MDEELGKRIVRIFSNSSRPCWIMNSVTPIDWSCRRKNDDDDEKYLCLFF